MSYRCDLCDKGKIYGETHTHKPGVAGGQWKKKAPRKQKISLPNLHNFNGYFMGTKAKWRFCTKCLRIVKADQIAFLEQKAKQEAKVKAAVKESKPAKTEAAAVK